MFRDAVDTAAGAAGLTLPIWIAWLPVFWQIVIALGGGVVLALTAYNKILEIKLKRQELDK